VNKAFTIPSGDHPSGLTLGPDNNVWFVESNHVGKITKTGVITEYALPTTGADSGAVTTGADGNLWFTAHTTRKIVKVTTGGTVTEFSLPSSPQCYPTGIAKGPDGNVWFRCTSNVGRITTAGVITLVPTSQPGNDGLENMTVGPDGNPWFTSDDTSIHEIDPATLTITDYTPPNTGFTNFTLVTGPDKNVWVGAYQNVVNVYIPKPLTVAPKSITFTGTGQVRTVVVTEHGTNSWTAVTSNPSVATVAQGSSANKFDVTSVGSGTATITISDAIGNLFKVKATVP
jgi:streptogramin lyase